MSFLDKLPVAFSSLALVNSIAIPFLIKEDTREVVKVPEKPKVVLVNKPAPKRKGNPGHITRKGEDAMEYLNCIDRGEEKEVCRGQYGFGE